LEWYFDDCIALKKEFPHLIAGVAFGTHVSASIFFDRKTQALTLLVMKMFSNHLFIMLRRCYGSGRGKRRRVLIYLLFSMLEKHLATEPAQTRICMTLSYWGRSGLAMGRLFPGEAVSIS